MPVFGTSAATFNDNGVTALYQHLARLLAGHGLPLAAGVLPAAAGRTSTDAASIIPPSRAGYLADRQGAVVLALLVPHGFGAASSFMAMSASMNWTPAPGRLRLRQGLPGGADDARREDHPDL